MLLGRTTSNNYNNMAEVKVRHKPRRQSSDRIAQRHSLHGGDRMQWLPMPSYHLHQQQQQQLLLHHQPQQQPQSGYFFNHLDGFIYVNDADNHGEHQQTKDSVRRKAESRQRTQLRKSFVNNNNNGVILVAPPMMVAAAAAAAPYYVADTLMSSVTYSAGRTEDDAFRHKVDSSLVGSVGRSRDRCLRRPTVLVLDRGCQASHSFDIRDYSVLQAATHHVDSTQSGDAPSCGRRQQMTRPQQQHSCCQCECHTATEEQPHNLIRHCQSHELSVNNGKNAALPCDQVGHASTPTGKVLKGMLTKSESFALLRRKNGSVTSQQKDEFMNERRKSQGKEKADNVQHRRLLMITGDSVGGGGGLIVSGVPGLGVSIPPRPESASEVEEDELRMIKRDKSSSESISDRNPNFLQRSSSSHRYFNLPRATCPTSSGNNHKHDDYACDADGGSSSIKKLSSSSSISVASISSSRLARSSDVNRKSLSSIRSSRGDPLPHPRVEEQQRSNDGRCPMPWKDSVFKRTLQRQTTFQWDSSQEEEVGGGNDAANYKMTLNESSFDRKFSHLSALLRNEQGGPHSLPLRLQSIPRAPIPVPPKETRGIKEDRDEMNYESLNNGKNEKNGRTPKSLPHPRPQREFSRKSLLLHVNGQLSGSSSSSSSSPSHEFNSLQPTSQIKASRDPFHHNSSQMYKVLNDRDGDYAYTYDCSLSPAFLIRYNEEGRRSDDHDDDDDTSGGGVSENIYEEINEVKKRVDVLKGQQPLNNSSSSSSTNSDSGVHVGSSSGGGGGGIRRFCNNDTLDFGPKAAAAGRNKRFAGRGSVDSFVTSDSYSEEERTKTTKAAAAAMTIPVQPVSSDEFCEIIRRHHNKVLEQLRLDPPQDEGRPCNRAGRSPSTSAKAPAKTSSATVSHAFKAKTFGFSSRRGKSVGSLNSSGCQKSSPQRPVIRCESMDRSLANRVVVLPKVVNKKNDKSGWQLLKTARKYLPWTSNKEVVGGAKDLEDEGNRRSKKESIIVQSFDLQDNDVVRHHQPAQRFQRSRLTSQWENLHSLPE